MTCYTAVYKLTQETMNLVIIKIKQWSQYIPLGIFQSYHRCSITLQKCLQDCQKSSRLHIHWKPIHNRSGADQVGKTARVPRSWNRIQQGTRLISGQTGGQQVLQESVNVSVRYVPQVRHNTRTARIKHKAGLEFSLQFPCTKISQCYCCNHGGLLH